MQILLGTSNPGKIIEIRDALTGLPVEIAAPKEVGILESPEETEDSFEKNAISKARFYFGKSSLPTLADDSGIIVEALKNELGIHTRRWGAGKDATDEEWITYFLGRMRHEKNKSARFVCVLAYIDEHEKLHTFEGTCDGEITSDLQAQFLPGLPISACFRPQNFDRVYSALSIEEKNRVSHRGKAIQSFRRHLERSVA